MNMNDSLDTREELPIPDDEDQIASCMMWGGLFGLLFSIVIGGELWLLWGIAHG